MEGTARIWFTPQQRAELWERWKNGQCVADIARALERRNKSGVYRILTLNGGIAPEPRRRAAGALRLQEREEISRGIAAGRSMRRIAQGLRRSPSTVSREIRRNGGCSAYRAGEADRSKAGSGERACDRDTAPATISNAVRWDKAKNPIF
jgi:DNA-binding CsgD family transcriptional regulator